VRGPRKHLKRLDAPKHWMLDKISGKWAPRPRSGPHKLRECLPLIILLRNRLKYALTAQEVSYIVRKRLIKVDSKVRTDPRYPAGFMDVITIEKTGEHFRLLYDTHGRFSIAKISPEEAKYKLCRVEKRFKSVGVPTLTTNDGRNIRYYDPAIRVHDSVVIDVKSGKITQAVPFKIGVLSMVTGGHNLGRVGIVTHLEKHPGNFDIVRLKDAAGNSFATRLTNVFVLGEHKSLISLPRDNGVRKTNVQSRNRRIEIRTKQTKTK